MNLTINGIDNFFDSLNTQKEAIITKMKKTNNDDKFVNLLTSELNVINNLQSNLMKLRKLILKRENTN